jgi:hypothetical protein
VQEFGDVSSEVNGSLKEFARANGKSQVKVLNQSSLSVDFGDQELFIFYKVDRLLAPGSGAQEEGTWQLLTPGKPEHTEWTIEESSAQ